MNNDIKEILDYLKDEKWDYYPSDMTPYKVFYMEERDKLLDYITNLQEENDYLKDIVSKTELSSEIKKADKWSKRELYKINYQRLLVNGRLQEENERLEHDYKIALKLISRYEKKINKASDMLVCAYGGDEDYYMERIKKAQNILQGEDKDDKEQNNY